MANYDHSDHMESLLHQESDVSSRSIEHDIEKSWVEKLTRGSISGSVFCLLCLTFGSGILALPLSFKTCGILLGTFVFIISAFCSYWTLRILLKVAFKENIFRYAPLLRKFYGSSHVFLFEISNLFGNFGAIIAYQQIISNFSFSFLQYCGVTVMLRYPQLCRFIQMFSFCLFTQIPITLVKDIKILHNVARYGTFALMYSIIVSIFEFPFYFMENYSYEKIKLFDLNFNIVKIMCIFIFAFSNHNGILNVIREEGDPNKEKGWKIMNWSFNVEMITYCIVLFTGYLSTYDETNEIFMDRPGQSIFMLIGKTIYIVSLTCHIGLFYFISKPSIQTLFLNGRQFTEIQGRCVAIGIMLGLTLIAYWCTSISNTISLIGATADLYMVFYMPVLLYLAYKPKRDYKRILSLAILILATAVSITFIVVDVFNNYYSNLLWT